METVQNFRRRLVWSVVLACVLLACSASAFALNPGLDISQYAHTSWKIRDGFTRGEILTITQTSDGYLWLGTEFGLLRFDGVTPVTWQPPPGEHLPSDRIGSLLAARDGTLWIGTSAGLASWQNNKLTLWPELAGQLVLTLLEDHEGAIWVGGSDVPTGRLCSIQNGKAECFGEDGRFGPGVLGLYEDTKDNLWAGVKDGIVRWKPGSPTFYSLPDNPDGIRGFCDFDGGLLIGTRNGLRRLIAGKVEAYPIPGTQQDFNARRLLRDRDGGLWIATATQGLMHVHQGRTDVFAQVDGLSADRVMDLFEDREGNIWVATLSGLDRFRDFSVSTFSAKQGCPDNLWTVLAATDGSVWLAAQSRLFRWLNGQCTIFGYRGSDAIIGTDKREDTHSPNSLFEDARGRIWVSTQGGIGYLEKDRFISVSGILGGPVHAMAADLKGNLWIANQDSGLYGLSPDLKVQHIAWTELGRKDFAYALGGDPLHNGVWLGFYQGGIAYLKDGQIRASYTTANGLGNGAVYSFQFDPDGTVWIATQGGLSRLKNGQVATLSSKNGLPCDGVQWVIEDDEHSFWLPSPCGLLRIARTELNAWSAAVDKDRNSVRMVQSDVFDSSDGMRSMSFRGGYAPAAAKSLDGELWFTGDDGVSVLDPRHLPFNKLPPPVHIEQITADRKPHDVTAENNGSLRLPALSRDLQIDYTALSLVAPEKIRFRYKLEGYDHDWQDAGNRRQAFYTNLPPRNYRFRVIACNNSGVWNETGTFLDFTIDPAYYQTTWFRVLLAIAFLMLLGVIYQLRLGQVAGQVRARMEERLEERERIARDLHDTLLQSVQGLILKFHAIAKQIPGDEPAHDALEKTLDHADEVLAEGRDRLRNLRGTSIPVGGLPAAFERVAEETPQGADATFKTVVEGRVRELHPMVREECYWIGREAVVNALTHSNGRKVEVEITYDPRQFRLRVRDDGRGIDPKTLEEGGRSDHWGLQGMRERAQKIGGQLNLWSRPETGTEVELSIPGASAYQTAHDKSKKFWLRPSSGNNNAAPKA
jgi:signal transduction histidine kinase/ligand-binding sensor domain-containing protein